MMFNKRNLLLMLLGMILNYILFLSCSALKIPIWLDMTGTVLVAVTGGFIPAAIVAIINNALICMKSGLEAFLFVLASIAVAAIVSVCMKMTKHLNGLTVFGIIFLGMCAKIISTILVILIIGSDNIVNTYELICYNAFVAQGMPIWTSVTVAMCITGIPDSIVIAMIVFCSYKLLHKSGVLKYKSSKKKLVLVYDSSKGRLNNI